MVCTTCQDPVKYLQSLKAVRERANVVFDLATQQKLRHFDYDAEKLQEVANYVSELIRRDYSSFMDVPPHGRWRSYCVKLEDGQRDLVKEHVEAWRADGADPTECCRRVIDLFVVSVLIDAGAGPAWTFKDPLFSQPLCRTEGLGMAAIRMFESGSFSSDSSQPYQADSVALKAFTDESLLRGFQVSDSNPLLGAESRAQLLRNLGQALEANPDFFGSENPRPGNMVDYLIKNKVGGSVSMDRLWEVIMDGFKSVWPATRTKLDGVSLGDVWACDTLQNSPTDPLDSSDPSQLVPFHKLSQWLCWSLSEAIIYLGGIKIDGLHNLTGLPEYRNGGLFVDMGVLTLKAEDNKRGLEAAGKGHYAIPLFEVSDPVIVEWRAMTVALLDKIHELVCKDHGLEKETYSLANILEGGTWKAGREVAAKKRPDTKEPPINIVSDGTVF
ncbi:hypothetical protein H4219_000850 [Mycoemilia scoparia]|uniref:DUF1688 domain-containing protein n=1 Tax=Mycoemilia scoparia TaxID=417184 RepID=A0A9W8A271_9FUNG|nr:hypothetical protein H4219_000850 [Mycoemilia scoparia]